MKFIKRIERMTPYVIFSYISAIAVLALSAPYLFERNFSAGAIMNVVIIGSFGWALLLFSAIGTFNNGDDDEIAEYYKKIEEEEKEIQKLARKLERNNRYK